MLYGAVSCFCWRIGFLEFVGPRCIRPGFVAGVTHLGEHFNILISTFMVK
jgi:hypothetical protein